MDPEIGRHPRGAGVGLGLALLAMATLTACESLPGSREQQSTVIGTAGGAAVGAAVSGENRLLGALLGGALGGGAGYLIGAKTDWFEQDADVTREEAEQAIEQARRDPATVEDVEGANTADLNDDGFVTTDELVAMEEAGLSDEEILDRLRATDQVFDLSDDQEEALREAGISRYVLAEMQEINRDERERVLSEADTSILGEDR